MADIEQLFYIWVTAMGGSIDHAVTDAESAARLRQSRSGYVALCGDEFQGADMSNPPGQKCRLCWQSINRWAERSRLINRVLTRPRETQARGTGRHACRVPGVAHRAPHCDRVREAP